MTPPPQCVHLGVGVGGQTNRLAAHSRDAVAKRTPNSSGSGIAAGVRLFGIVDVRDPDRQLDTARASSPADPGLALADDDNSRRAIAREPDLGSWRPRLQRRVAPEADEAPYARGGRIAVASTSIR